MGLVPITRSLYSYSIFYWHSTQRTARVGAAAVRCQGGLQWKWDQIFYRNILISRHRTEIGLLTVSKAAEMMAWVTALWDSEDTRSERRHRRHRADKYAASDQMIHQGPARGQADITPAVRRAPWSCPGLSAALGVMWVKIKIEGLNKLCPEVNKTLRKLYLSVCWGRQSLCMNSINAMCSRLKFISVNVRIGIIMQTGSWFPPLAPIFVWWACNGNCERVKCSWSPRVYDVMPGHDHRMANPRLWLAIKTQYWLLIGQGNKRGWASWHQHHDPDTGTIGRVGGGEYRQLRAKEVSSICRQIGIFLSP